MKEVLRVFGEELSEVLTWLPKPNPVGNRMNSIINIFLYVVGTLAVVMIIVGGIQYALSAGDAGKMGKAKNTIMWSVVGLVIAILAWAIVNFVLGVFN